MLINITNQWKIKYKLSKIHEFEFIINAATATFTVNKQKDADLYNSALIVIYDTILLNTVVATINKNLIYNSYQNELAYICQNKSAAT